MKQTTLLLLLLLAAITGYSQDIITKKNGEDIKSKVLEITPTEIKYKKFETPDGATYTIYKNEVLMIRYQDGTKDMFSNQYRSEQNTNTTYATGDMRLQGSQDAKEYYKHHRVASGWTFAAAFIFPITGLIPAIACSSTPPKDINLDCPHPELLRNMEYHQAYVERAHRIKRNKTWLGYGLGVVGAVVLYSIIASAQQ